MDAWEKQEFNCFMDGLYEEIKRRNNLFGKPIMPQEQWVALSDEEKTMRTVGAVASLSRRKMAQLMRIAHDAIHDERIKQKTAIRQRTWNNTAIRTVPFSSENGESQGTR